MYLKRALVLEDSLLLFSFMLTKEYCQKAGFLLRSFRVFREGYQKQGFQQNCKRVSKKCAALCYRIGDGTLSATRSVALVIDKVPSNR